MAKVLGLGGVFFKSPNPTALYEWYGKWLGIESDENGATFQPENMPPNSLSVWSAFSVATTYFFPSVKGFMFNLIVDNLEEALEQVQEGGAEIVGEIQSYDYGRFGWFIDPDGNKVELWEPV